MTEIYFYYGYSISWEKFKKIISAVLLNVFFFLYTNEQNSEKSVCVISSFSPLNKEEYFSGDQIPGIISVQQNR